MSRRHQRRSHYDRPDPADDRRPRRERSSDDRRYGSRYGDPGGSARAATSERHGRDAGGRMPTRAHGGRCESPRHRSQGNPRVGSQRGEDAVQGVSGRAGRQFGDLHGRRPSEGESAGFHGEEQFAGGTGRDRRDRRYGSRRGHGSERREDRRTG